MVHETKSQSKARSSDEGKVMTRKQKEETKSADQEEQKHSPKRVKKEDEKKGSTVKNGDEKKGSAVKNEDKEEDEDGKDEVNSAEDEEIRQQFLKFCKETSEHLSVQQMRQILEANGQDAGDHDDAVVPIWG